MAYPILKNKILTYINSFSYPVVLDNPCFPGYFCYTKQMVTPKTIAIIGACSKNGMIAGRKMAANNNLLLVDEDKEGLLKLKAELELQPGIVGVDIMECFQDMGWEADAIVLAVQSTKDKEIFTLMKPFVTGKTVIVFSSGEKETEELKSLLPHSNVISINEADCECVNKMQMILNETL